MSSQFRAGQRVFISCHHKNIFNNGAIYFNIDIILLRAPKKASGSKDKVCLLIPVINNRYYIMFSSACTESKERRGDVFMTVIKTDRDCQTESFIGVKSNERKKEN